MSSFVLLYTAIVTLVSLLPGYNTHEYDCKQPEDIDSCPPWFCYNGTSCVCGRSLGGLVSCNQTEQLAYLLLDYCMTFDSRTNDTLVFYCPYDTKKDNSSLRVNALKTTVRNLNNFTCGPLSRNGTYCEQCHDNYGPSVFTENLSCFNCDHWFNGWAVYFSLEYFPLTAFFFIILLTGISPRTGHLNSFVLLSQLVSSLFVYGNQAQLIPPFGIAYEVVVRFLRTCYGFWNLDFFRGLIPDFCVSPNMSNLVAISLHLMPPFYPILLLIIGSVCILLHQRNFRPFVRVWKPFRQCLSHYPVPNDLRRSLINVFVTFYLLGYTKILSTCLMLLVRGQLFHLKKDHKYVVLLISPDIVYFSSGHAVYAFFSMVLLTLLIVLPALCLVLYPVLQKKCIALRRFAVLEMIADSFSSCFRDGKDGRMDCRHFAGGYLLLRVFAMMLFGVIWSPAATYIALSVLFAVTAVTVALCRPYRKQLHNVLDVVLYALFALGIMFAAIANKVKMGDNVQIGLAVIILVSLTAPLIYATIYIIVRLIKIIIVMVSCSCRKRRQYEDISKYDEDPVPSKEHDRRSAHYIQ